MIARGSLIAAPVLVAMAVLAVDAAPPQKGRAPAPPAPSRNEGLFSPTELGLLETPDRADWQKPDLIMDTLKIAEAARVADIGAGGGFFTVRLARRVGPNGRVYAQDIQPPMLEAINRRVAREGLNNVETRLGTGDDPNLPGGLDAVLVVDIYQEVDPPNRVTFLRNLARVLKPGGRIGIVNYKPGRGGPGPDLRVPSEAVEADARNAGLRVLDRANLPFQYLIVLGH